MKPNESLLKETQIEEARESNFAYPATEASHCPSSKDIAMPNAHAICVQIQLYANMDIDFALPCGGLRIYQILRAADKTPFNVLSIMSCHPPKPNSTNR